jgi:hypothetical protein
MSVSSGRLLGLDCQLLLLIRFEQIIFVTIRLTRNILPPMFIFAMDPTLLIGRLGLDPLKARSGHPIDHWMRRDT